MSLPRTCRERAKMTSGFRCRIIWIRPATGVQQHGAWVTLYQTLSFVSHREAFQRLCGSCAVKRCESKLRCASLCAWLCASLLALPHIPMAKATCSRRRAWRCGQWWPALPRSEVESSVEKQCHTGFTLQACYRLVPTVTPQIGVCVWQHAAAM